MIEKKLSSEAKDFRDSEKQFQLGFLPTEQANPKTRHMDEVFAADIYGGVRLLQSVDRDIVPMARKIFKSEEFHKFVASMTSAIRSGGKVVFSGCGATGRLSIMLESCWRKYWNLKEPDGCIRNQVFSIMTGGDFALVRSVEFFEDYMEFGRQQVRETGIGHGDVLVAITEGGETSSVLGTAEQALSDGADVHILFNNPADVLCERIERSRRIIKDPHVNVLDLHCGPMALAGSTRMQATTAELLVVGMALELTCGAIASGEKECDTTSFVFKFEKLLDELEKNTSIDSITKWIQIEEQAYRAKGLVTYFADTLMLDIFTDTTERSPTFNLPKFKAFDDVDSPQPWAFVKNPLYGTDVAWERIFERKPNCLEWTTPLYRQMNTPENLAVSPPAISRGDLYKIQVGNENDAARYTCRGIGICVMSEREYQEGKLIESAGKQASELEEFYNIVIGGQERESVIAVPVNVSDSRLGIWERLAVKLVLNTVSTGTMVRLGRVRGNWMSCVEASNKKLIDRSIRLISELAGLTYSEACLKLFEAKYEFGKLGINPQNTSIVNYVLNK